MRADHVDPGEELRLRDQAAAGRKRRGLAVIYAFARRIDDIGDGTMAPQEKIAALEDARQAIAGLSQQNHDDPVLLALADVERRFPSPCRRSASSSTDASRTCAAPATRASRTCCTTAAAWPAPSAACPLHLRHQRRRRAGRPACRLLGVALQLTNILRDVREDYQNGRIYLPAEDIAKFDVSFDMENQSAQPQFARLVEFEADRARDWYATGMGLLPMLDRRSAACTGAMAGIYGGCSTASRRGPRPC